MRSDARKRWLTHKHIYRLAHRHHHPRGYLFACARCSDVGLYPFKFIRDEHFWGAS